MAQPAPTGVALAAARPELIRDAFRLEYVTVALMLVEAVVAIWSSVQAASVCLLALGIDSLIELASAVVLIWRLTVELRRGQVFAESAEPVASRVAGTLLFVLAAYAVAGAAWKLWTQTRETLSWPGLFVTALAMPTMYVLARRKTAVAEALGGRAMRGDAIESVTCGWLSLVVVVSLVAESAPGGSMPRRRSVSSGSW
jgi:divalent metal cation (Fe/Co/Zn/Cd) transporter